MTDCQKIQTLESKTPDLAAGQDTFGPNQYQYSRDILKCHKKLFSVDKQMENEERKSVSVVLPNKKEKKLLY